MPTRNMYSSPEVSIGPRAAAWNRFIGDRTVALTLNRMRRSRTRPLLRAFVVQSKRNAIYRSRERRICARSSQGSISRASVTSRNSITSSRRSPPSYLATKDCGGPSISATWVWVTPLVLRAAISRFSSRRWRVDRRDFGIRRTGQEATGSPTNPSFVLSHFRISCRARARNRS